MWDHWLSSDIELSLLQRKKKSQRDHLEGALHLLTESNLESPDLANENMEGAVKFEWFLIAYGYVYGDLKKILHGICNICCLSEIHYKNI